MPITKLILIFTLLNAIGSTLIYAQPQRIVSLNICTDQLLLLLAEREHITSLTWLSADPEESPVSDQVKDISLNYGQAEEIIPLHPDLIIAGTYTARFTVELLRRQGYRVELIEPAISLQQFRKSLLEVARLIGQTDRAKHLLAKFDRDLELLTVEKNTQSETNWPSALIYAGKGFTAGTASLESDLLHASGLRNQADAFGLDYSGYVDLETLLKDSPDILVISHYHLNSPSLATQFLQHPALTSISVKQILVELPSRLLSCTPEALLEAVRRLYKARLKWLDSNFTNTSE